MVFEVDPDKPNIPAIARILSGMGVLSLIGSGICILLSFSSYTWVNEAYVMIGAGAAFVLALIFVAQAKTLELLAIVSARVRSRFAIENLAKSSVSTPGAVKSPPMRQPAKERVIHVSDEQAREQGFRLK
tara:strand:+ start:369 stop:758 length:390 start_codon:yes stop_codon:yes gene_type:complete